MESYESLSLFICIILYTVGLSFAVLHACARRWMERGNRNVLENAGERVLAQLSVSYETRNRLLYLSQNLVFALVLRLTWLVVKYENWAPKPPKGAEACHNYHTLLAGANRLSQLLFFTSFTSVVTFWVEVLRKHHVLQQQHEGLASQERLARALAQSTLRRGEESAVVQLPDLSDRSLMYAQHAKFSPNSIQILVNFWAYGIVFVLLSVQWYECDVSVYEWIYEGETVCIAVFYALLSAACLWYGCQIIAELRATRDHLAKRLAFYSWLFLVATVIAFPVRAALFLLRPVFGVQLSGLTYQILYPWFFYPIPELLPTVILLSLMMPFPKKRGLPQDVYFPLVQDVTGQPRYFGSLDEAADTQEDTASAVYYV